MLKDMYLDPALTLRSAKWNDADGVAQVIYAACVADGDAILAMSPEELQHEWQNPDFDVEQDAFVVETSDKRVVGYAELTNSYEHAIFNMDGNVHPDFKGRGAGTILLRAVEQRARELMRLAKPDVRVVIETTLNKNDLDGNVMHRHEGYQPSHYHWRMEIMLNVPPVEPALPEGLELRSFRQGEQDEAVWKANMEAFRDHPGHQDWTLEEWRRVRFDDPEFDSTLWKIAWAGDEVAGFSLNRYRTGIGWIRALGVRRPWRKRGLGEALLFHSFGEYYRRGVHTVGLGVRAQNPTGATRLYQRVGMLVASEHVTYKKELRSGRDVETSA